MEDHLRLCSETALRRLTRGTAQLWVNPCKKPAAEALLKLPFGIEDIVEADARLRRFAPLIEKLFPETAAAHGVIESPLTELESLREFGGLAGRLFLKRDSELPIAGSVKARGGIYEVLLHTERLLGGAVFSMSPEEIRAKLGGYTVQVGSTGNLGLSIGIMSAALGYRAVVHMSADAKQWKKELLRQKGVTVIEYEGDYSSAVLKGRELSNADPMSYFVDDENSVPLFMGYAAAALRLKEQLREAGVTVDAEHPLELYLPCGVGGAPGGICFGVKTVFGDAANCWFVEPTQAPCMLAAFLKGGPVPVTELGLSGRTEADGLAVGTASRLVYDAVRELVSGEITVPDELLQPYQNKLFDNEGIFIEPSSAASLAFMPFIDDELPPGEAIPDGPNATHIAWATGGRLVPEEERRKQLYTRVSAALIWREGRFMICRRPPHKARGGLWEFVGGKVERGETGAEALVRECREELGVEIEVKSEFMSLLHRYPDLTVLLTLYNARIKSGEPRLLEHTAIEWITPAETGNYEFCPADEQILARLAGLDEVRRRLAEHADPDYRLFQSRLVPTVDPQSILGVRLPDLRATAKAIKNTPAAEEFLNSLPHALYDENMLHALLINEEKELERSLALLDDFLPRVDCWAVCDTLRPKPFKKRRAELKALIPGWLDSGHVYTVRFGLLMLMTHFLDADFTPRIPELALDAAKKHEGEDYYIDMMAAWFFATALAKKYGAVLPYITQRRLPPKVHSMTIRKACESFRLTAEQKEELKRWK